MPAQAQAVAGATPQAKPITGSTDMAFILGNSIVMQPYTPKRHAKSVGPTRAITMSGLPKRPKRCRTIPKPAPPHKKQGGALAMTPVGVGLPGNPESYSDWVWRRLVSSRRSLG